MLLAVACLALALWLISVIWSNGGKATFAFFGSLLSQTITLDNLTAAMATLVWFVVAFGVVVVAILYFLSRALFKRAVSQTALDELARLRNVGIEEIYAAPPKDAAEFERWKAKYEKWQSDTLDHIKRHFPKADYLHAKTLGLIPEVRFRHILNAEHERLVQFFAKRLEIIEQMLASYRR